MHACMNGLTSWRQTYLLYLGTVSQSEMAGKRHEVVVSRLTLFCIFQIIITLCMSALLMVNFCIDSHFMFPICRYHKDAFGRVVPKSRLPGASMPS